MRRLSRPFLPPGCRRSARCRPWPTRSLVLRIAVGAISWSRLLLRPRACFCPGFCARFCTDPCLPTLVAWEILRSREARDEIRSVGFQGTLIENSSVDVRLCVGRDAPLPAAIDVERRHRSLTGLATVDVRRTTGQMPMQIQSRVRVAVLVASTTGTAACLVAALVT